MLAAAPDRNSTLGLFQVVLSSVTQHSEANLSDSVKKHVVVVLQAASAVAANPATINKDTPAEALELALRIRGQDDLRQQVSQIGTFENIKADVAQKILKSLQLYAA